MHTLLNLLASLLLLFPMSFLHAATVSQPDPSMTLTRIAFGSCSFQSVPLPIFRALVASAPDLYLSLGDAIYGDYDLKTKAAYDVTPESLRREWQVLADNPDWQYLVENVPVMSTWDNHDYGHHSAGAEFPLKEQSKKIFLDFFSEPAHSPRRKRPGIYDAKIFGPAGRRVQVIFLDTRSFKSAPTLADRPADAAGSLGKYAPDSDPEATLLGEAQWAWLAEQFLIPVGLRLVASSGQIIADQKGMDEWGNYPLERQRLLDLVAASNPERTLLLSGNVHFSEISALRHDSAFIVDFTSSGLTHVNETYAAVENPYRIAGPVVEPNFGLVEIDWDSDDEPRLTLSAVNAGGERIFEYHFPETSVK